MNNFRLHSNIPEIRMEIMVYANGEVIKHIKELAIVKVGLTDLLKIERVTMRIQTVITVPCLSLCHYKIVLKYFTESTIPHCYVFFLSQGNLRMSRDQFCFLIIPRQKSLGRA